MENAYLNGEDFTEASVAALKESGDELSSGGRNIRVLMEGSNIYEEQELATAAKVGQLKGAPACFSSS